MRHVSYSLSWDLVQKRGKREGKKEVWRCEEGLSTNNEKFMLLKQVLQFFIVYIKASLCLAPVSYRISTVYQKNWLVTEGVYSGISKGAFTCVCQ